VGHHLVDAEGKGSKVRTGSYTNEIDRSKNKKKRSKKKKVTKKKKTQGGEKKKKKGQEKAEEITRVGIKKARDRRIATVQPLPALSRVKCHMEP